MRLNSRRSLTALVAASAALAAGAVAVAVAQSGDGRSDAGPEQVTAVPPELEAMMAIFRGERGSDDDVPPEIAAALARAVEAAGANPALSRRAGTGWAIPGNGFVCHAEASAGGCADLENVDRAGVTVGVGFHHANGWEVSGLAHDRVVSVAVVGPGGERAAALRDNAFSVSVAEPPTGLRVESRDGSVVEIPLSVPSDRPAAPPGGDPADRVR